MIIIKQFNQFYAAHKSLLLFLWFHYYAFLDEALKLTPRSISDIGILAVVATLDGYTYRLFYSVSLPGSLLGLFIRTIYLELLYSSFCLYIWG
jgi:hypothetical protein